MKNKKVYLIISIIIFVFISTIIFYKEDEVLSDTNKINPKPKSNLLTMMVETDAGTGTYEEDKSDGWKSDGYVFNQSKSGCVNKTKISYDKNTKEIVLVGESSDKCYVYFDLEAYSNVSEVCQDKDNLAGCIKNLRNKSSSKLTNIYYHDENLTNGAGDNSYRYAGGDFKLTDKATSAGLNTLGTDNDASTDGVINFYCGTTKSFLGNSCTEATHYYTLQYDTTNTQYQTYEEVLNKAVSDGYLTKDNVKNFLCFASSAETCPTDNLYRIIGVFDNKVKVIKWDFARSNLLGEDGDYASISTQFFSADRGENPNNHLDYRWNYKSDTTINSGNGSHIWSTSLLNTVNLNKNYLTNIGNTWANKIATSYWKVSGNASSGIMYAPAKTAYQNEIISPSDTLTTESYEAKIGLFYPSDYGFATDQNNWTENLVTYNKAAIYGTNWMYSGYGEWSLTPRTDYETYVFYVRYNGFVGSNYATYLHGIRPVFFLDKDVTYKSGIGTKDSPIIIN